MIEINMKFDMSICDTKDIASFYSLMVNNGFQVSEQYTENADGMGPDLNCIVLFIPIIPKAIEEITSIFKIWLLNRHVSFTLEDKHSGRSIKYESSSGRISDKQLEKCIKFMSKEGVLNENNV